MTYTREGRDDPASYEVSRCILGSGEFWTGSVLVLLAWSALWALGVA